MQKGGKRIFSSRQLGMTVYFRPVMIMVLGQQNLPRQNVWLLRARCSRTETFISTLGPLLMGRLTTTFITDSQPHLSQTHNHIYHRFTTTFITDSQPHLSQTHNHIYHRFTTTFITDSQPHFSQTHNHIYHI